MGDKHCNEKKESAITYFKEGELKEEAKETTAGAKNIGTIYEDQHKMQKIKPIKEHQKLVSGTKVTITFFKIITVRSKITPLMK